MTFSALILAGGKSSRMGRDKAWLPIGGQTLMARQIELARGMGATEILLSGHAGLDYSAFGCRVLEDEIQNAGPLAGIERGLDSLSTTLLLVLAVDLPAMSAQCLQRLAAHCHNSGAIPRVAGQIEPLAAFYPRAARPLANILLRGKNRAVTTFAEYCVQSGLAQFVELPASETKYFMNWNSLDDFALPTADKL